MAGRLELRTIMLLKALSIRYKVSYPGSGSGSGGEIRMEEWRIVDRWRAVALT